MSSEPSNLPAAGDSVEGGEGTLSKNAQKRAEKAAKIAEEKAAKAAARSAASASGGGGVGSSGGGGSSSGSPEAAEEEILDPSKCVAPMAFPQPLRLPRAPLRH